MKLTGTPCDAEDLVQEILTRVYAHADSLDAIADLGPYLSRVRVASGAKTFRLPVTVNE